MKNLVILFLGCIILGGCGVKPNRVDPPVGAEQSEFPRTYPDLSTDPAP